MQKPFCVTVLLAAVFAFPTYCQVADSGLILRSNARLVEVDVIVSDKKGRPVVDLTKDDFEIFDEGKRQPVRIFSRNSGEAPLVQAPSARNVFTNFADSPTSSGGVTVILIDSLNTKWVNQAYALQQVIKFLTQIRPDDHSAIYSMGFGGFRILYDFTQDASELVTKVASWRGEAQRPVEDGERELADFLKGRNPDFVESQQMGDSERFGPVQSLRILSAVADQLASIPGRKNVIWISEGFPLVDWNGALDLVYGTSTDKRDQEKANPQSFHEEMVNAMRVISNDNVAIYPVDALCLFDPFFSASSQDSTNVGFKALARSHAREDAMDEIAKRTGGKAFYETNDIQNAIRIAANDSKTVYTLGFYAHPAYSGKFRTLRVKANRPDVRLRYRQGYMDAPKPSKSENARRVRLENAARSPLDANGIALSAKIDLIKESAYRLQLNIRASQVGEVDVLLVQRDERGQQVDGVEQTSLADVSSSADERWPSEGLVFHCDFTLKPNTQVLRIVVGDLNSERLGSVSVRRAALGK